MAGFASRVVRGCREALVIGCIAGFSSVLIDAGHVVCAVIRGESVVETYGCRLVEPYIIPFVCIVGGVLIALVIRLDISISHRTWHRV
jgi:hypothetical protein